MMFGWTGRGELRQSLKETTAAEVEEFPTPGGSIPKGVTYAPASTFPVGLKARTRGRRKPTAVR